MKQEFTSKRTSINSKKVPALFTAAEKLNAFAGKRTVFDYGCGAYDTAKEFVEGKGCLYMGYDKYNRPDSANLASLMVALVNNIDIVTCSNVLNVVAEPEIMENIISDCADIVSENGVVYFTVYEGNKSGIPSYSKERDSFQANKKTTDYIPILEKYFTYVEKHGKLLICRN